MKNILCSLALLTITFGAFGQETIGQKRFEVKMNATNLLIFNFFEVSGEYLIHEESSVGISLLTSFNSPDVQNEDDLILFDRRRSYSITPYFRQYLSRGYAKGFFFEAFGMLNAGTEYEFEVVERSQGFSEMINEKDYTNFAFGLSVGGKWVSNRGFTAEIYLGLGRNLIDTDAYSRVVSRGGIGLGYRF